MYIQCQCHVFEGGAEGEQNIRLARKTSIYHVPGCPPSLSVVSCLFCRALTRQLTAFHRDLQERGRRQWEGRRRGREGSGRGEGERKRDRELTCRRSGAAPTVLLSGPAPPHAAGSASSLPAAAGGAGGRGASRGPGNRLENSGFCLDCLRGLLHQRC